VSDRTRLATRAVWLVLIVAEILHGIDRGIFLVPHVGESRSSQIGVFTGSIIILAIALIRRLPGRCGEWHDTRSVGPAVVGLIQQIPVQARVTLSSIAATARRRPSRGSRSCAHLRQQAATDSEVSSLSRWRAKPSIGKASPELPNVEQMNFTGSP
jgi:hypothetical protein